MNRRSATRSLYLRSVKTPAVSVSLVILTCVSLFGAKTSALPSSGRGIASEKIDGKLKHEFEALRQQDGFPGMTVAYVLPDGSSSSISVGYADHERKISMRPDDRMFSGSVGKTFVAAVALQLVDERKLGLDEKISKWFGQTSWFSHLPNSQQITLRMLMNHTSGIPNHVAMDQFAADLGKSPQRVWTPLDLIGYAFDKPALFPAGKGWSYADTNYILVGMIIEKVAEDTYYNQLSERILKPFHLDHTSPSDRPDLSDVIPGYPDPKLPFALPHKVMTDGKYSFNPQVEWTGGGVVTTSHDLARWAKDLYEGKVFSRDSLEQMVRGVATGHNDKYGLATAIHETDLGIAYGHDGEFPGYNTIMTYWPKYHIAVAAQTNTDDPVRLRKPDLTYSLDAAKIIVRSLNQQEQ